MKGIKNLHGPHIDKHGKTFLPELGLDLPLLDALNTEHPSDAHITCYALSAGGKALGQIPLMTKGVLKQVQKDGGELVTTCIGLDWDCPGHVKLSPALLMGFLTSFLAACELDERLGSWTAYYTTRHGARVFYDLVEPVKVEDGEKYVTSIIKEFKKHNVMFDTACRDWTRRYRLPKVLRDGLATSKEPMFELQVRDIKLDIKQFKKASIDSLVATKPFERKASHPDTEEVHSYLFEDGSQGREVMSPYHKKAKACLRPTEFFGPIFTNNVALCGDTGRNDFFLKMLGTIVPKLISKCYANAEQIYAILDGPLCELEVAAGKQHPAEHCWNLIQDFYERDYAKYVEDQEKKAQAIEDGQTALEKMAIGMQQWCDAEELYDDDNAVVEAFVMGRIFANVGKYYYPINEDGWYSNLTLLNNQLVPKIRKSFLKDIIQTEKYNPQGELVSISPVEIANKHTTIVHEVQMSPLQGARGRIDNIDGDKPTLQLPMYQRNDYLPAEFNGAVDGWLDAVFEHNAVAAKEWLGYALDFEAGPICALSMAGAGSVGKKMIVEGLAECLVEPCSATAMDLCGSTNGALMKTPFLFVNEGMPKAKDMSPSDTFKSYTAGDAIRVRELYKPAINVINPLRIILTANDHGLLHELTRGKELTPETKKAMGERLLHFDISSKAETYLDRLGGRAFTEKDGGRWIRGDSGQPTDYVVAKHFMWLYKNRPRKAQNTRYCVMGNCNESESFQIASRSEFLPIVIRGIIGLFDRPGSLKDHKKATKTGRALVTLQGVMAYIREINEERISERDLEAVIKSLLRVSKPTIYNHLHYYELNTQSIIDFAHPWGIPCHQLVLLNDIGKKEIV